jgi:hypothetical protein
VHPVFKEFFGRLIQDMTLRALDARSDPEI